MIGTKDMIVYNLIRLFIVLVLVCYVKPMDEDTTTQHRKRNIDGREKIQTEGFRTSTRGQQSQQPTSYPPHTSTKNTATSSAQHGISNTATETNAITQGRRSIVDIILPKTNRKYPKLPTVVNRKWKDHSTSDEYKFMPKVFGVKRIQSLNHQLPEKLAQFEMRDGTVGEFTSSRVVSAEGKRKNDGGNSLLSEILLKVSNHRKEGTSTRKRRSVEDVNSGSELPSGEGRRATGEIPSGQESLLSENNTSGQEQSGQEPSGPESAGNEAISGHIVPGDNASSGSTFFQNGSTISGYTEDTTPRTFSPLPVDGDYVCNTCRGVKPAPDHIRPRPPESEKNSSLNASPEEYGNISISARQARIMTDDLIAKEKRRIEGDHNTSAAALDQEQQDYFFPVFDQTQSGERYIRNQYISLAVSLAHFRLVRKEEEATGHHHSYADDFREHEVQHLQKLLCQLNTLPWRQNFSCELGMRKYEISGKFQSMGTDWVERYYRNLVLFDYISKTFANIERFFTSFSQGNETLSGRIVSDENATASQPSGQTGSGPAVPGQESSSGYDSSGPESFTVETPTGDASSSSTFLENGSTISGRPEDTIPLTEYGFTVLPVDGDYVCNTCGGKDRAEGLPIQLDFVRSRDSEGNSSLEEYANIAISALEARIMTDDLIAKEKRRVGRWHNISSAALDQEQQDYRLPWNPPKSLHRIRHILSAKPRGRQFSTSSQSSRRERREEYWLPWRTGGSLRRIRRQLSPKEIRDRYIRNQYTSLAVSLAHFRLVRKQEEDAGHHHSYADDFREHEVQYLHKLLCQLNTLPWRQNFTCELGMRKYEISGRFQSMGTNRVKRFYRNLVLFDYISKTFGNIEKFFTCLSLGDNCAFPLSHTEINPWSGLGDGINVDPPTRDEGGQEDVKSR